MREIEKMRNGTLLIRDDRKAIASASFVNRAVGWRVRCHFKAIWPATGIVKAKDPLRVCTAKNKADAVERMRECERHFDAA